MSHSAMSRAPIAPKVAPAWPALNTYDNIRSYSAVTALGSSPSSAGKTLATSAWAPSPMPVIPPSVSTRSTGTSVTPERIAPFASPTGRPHRCAVVVVR